MVEWSAAGEMLSRAAELIEERGWQQGATKPVELFCAATALEAAFLEGKYSVVDFNYARASLSRVVRVPLEPRAEAGESLAVPYWGRELMEWNDAPGRSEEEVIDAFTTASNRASNLSAKAESDG